MKILSYRNKTMGAEKKALLETIGEANRRSLLERQGHAVPSPRKAVSQVTT